MDQESLPALVSRYVQLKANGKGFVGRCVFHADDGESLRVDEKSWRCLQCGAHDGQSDAAGWLMAWSQISREEAASISARAALTQASRKAAGLTSASDRNGRPPARRAATMLPTPLPQPRSRIARGGDGHP